MGVIFIAIEAVAYHQPRVATLLRLQRHSSTSSEKASDLPCSLLHTSSLHSQAQPAGCPCGMKDEPLHDAWHSK